MTDDPRIGKLIDELLNSDATPEEVCADCPELLPAVRARWELMRRVQAELNAMFPAPPEADSTKPQPEAEDKDAWDTNRGA